MLCRLSVLALCAASLAAAAPSDVVERDVSPVAAFPANLARRFSSTVGLLRSRGRAEAAPVVERSISDELVAMLKGATQPPRQRLPSASAAFAPEATGAAAAAPSASQASSERAAKRSIEYVKQKIQDTPWEALDSTLLCPGTETACPIFPRMGTYECIETDNSLESCGGCASRGEGEDCTAIKGAQGVGCSAGRCQVFTCQDGYKLDHNRCRKVRSTKA
ncbi:hypothetical protein BCR35DRAFT_328533 [Leucosporidium creatinivorum]|uniref:Protein CPL1-like domain-containing protein n=1 Tax=Leucosporidium creatinivorum TaxID=106004 RepID=A0A1Y2G412_9BASI|nr:hypothetical protein BCR35DRAFT_328533 [Leucosporidium creatinivorum]